MRKELKERFSKGGIEALFEAEVVEVLLSMEGKRDCELKAKELVSEYGSLREVLDNTNTFSTNFLKSVVVKYLEAGLEKKKFICRSSKEVFDYLYASMRGETKEQFEVLFLDVKNHLIKAETLFKGSLTSTSVYPRQVIIKALEYKASALIFAHNHPSGEAEPSEADKDITKSLILAGSIMEMRVLDHIIIGNNKYFSFADCGLIREYELASRLAKKG